MACLVVQQFLVYLPKRSSSCFKLERTMLFSVVKNNMFNISIFPCTFNKKKPFPTSVSFVEKFSIFFGLTRAPLADGVIESTNHIAPLTQRRESRRDFLARLYGIR